MKTFLVNGVGTTLSNMKRKEIASIVDKLSREVRDEMKSTPSPFQIQEVWAQYIENAEFGLSLWSSQRLCYGSVYYAYENFLRRCVGVAKGDADYSPRTPKLQSDLNGLLGSNLGDLCLADDVIQIARLVRHSLAHNGGSLTPKLRNKTHGLRVENDTIHIMPDDTRRLYDSLKDRVTTVIERAVVMHEFQP